MRNKLTDAEIKKALECCTTKGASCKDCPAFVKVDRSNCKKYFRGALDLINRQEDKCKAYKHYYDECLKDLKNANAEIKKLQVEYRWLDQESDILRADVENLNRICDEVNAENENLKAEIERLKEINNCLLVAGQTWEKSYKNTNTMLIKVMVEKYPYIDDMIAEAKAEAYKECIAKVENHVKTKCNPYGKPTFDYDTSIKILQYLDNLLNELVGDTSAGKNK